MKTLSTKYNNKVNRNTLSIFAAISLSSLIVGSTMLPSLADFNNSVATHITATAGSISAPTNLVIKNVRLNETDLTWTKSNSELTTGYRVLRAATSSGPWTSIAEVSGRDTVLYTDATSGTSSWHYSVESVFNTWSSNSPVIVAPPAAGLSFYDNFLTPGSLNGRKTDDGISTWQVWNGSVDVAYHDDFPGWGYGAQGKGYSSNKPAMAVVKTAVSDATIWMSDIDGSEGAILRGKDPLNYIYAGGVSGTDATSSSFEIVSVKNGVRTVLASQNVRWSDRDMKIVISGNSLKVYINATKPTDAGQLFLETTVESPSNDKTDTHFGVGFVNSNIMRGFRFDALL